MSIKYRLFCHIFTFSPARRAAGKMNAAVVFRRHLPVGEHNTGQAAAHSCFQRFGNETSRSSLSAFPTGRAAAVSQAFLRLKSRSPFYTLPTGQAAAVSCSLPRIKKRFRCVCRSPGASRPSGKGGAHPPKNAGARARRRRRTHPPPQA